MDDDMAGDGVAGHVLSPTTRRVPDDNHVPGDHVAGEFRFASNR
jgi:hypothetical protein